MKKLALSLAAMTICAFAFAQKDNGGSEPQNVVKINPIGFIFGSGSIAYERALSAKSSILVAPTFGAFSFGGFKYTSFGLGAEYRFYLSNTKNAPTGLYAAPGVSFTTGKIKEDGFSTEAKFTSIGAKGVFGHQWIWNSGFTLDLNGGISYQSFTYKDTENSVFSGLKASGILPNIGIAVGYAF
jgi:Protein of unknown function (DUF3575)